MGDCELLRRAFTGDDKIVNDVFNSKKLPPGSERAWQPGSDPGRDIKRRQIPVNQPVTSDFGVCFTDGRQSMYCSSRTASRTSTDPLPS